MPSNCKGAEKDNIVESPQTTSSSIHGGSSISRPSSNSNNRPLSIGPPKGNTAFFYNVNTITFPSLLL